MKITKIEVIILLSLFGFIILLIGNSFRESYKERHAVYSRCYDVTNDYEKALACIEIHKYLRGE